MGGGYLRMETEQTRVSPQLRIVCVLVSCEMEVDSGVGVAILKAE